MPTHLTVRQPGCTSASRPWRRRAVRTATPRQRMLPCARI